MTSFAPTPRVRIVTVFLGPLPPYFPLWLRSCAANPGYEWLLFLDADVRGLPTVPNVRYLPITLREFRERAEAALGFSVALNTPYKLADFKPAFGLIFAEHLDGIEFWGCCDLDMCFGRLSGFLTDDLFARYDKLLSRGHLTLYRNTSRVNSLFREGAPGVDPRAILSDPQTRGFDEWRGIHRIFDHHGVPQFHREFIADISPARYRFTTTAPPNHRLQVFYWDRGRVFRAALTSGGVTRQEYAYIHFQKRPLPAPAFDIANADAWYFSPDGFLSRDADPSGPAEFGALNRDRLLYPLLFRLRRLRSRARGLYVKQLEGPPAR